FRRTPEDVALLSRTRGLAHRWLGRCGGEPAAAELEWGGTAARTCRMGADPRSRVCDAPLRGPSGPNLYPRGAATFPIGGALPPALTIAALADRLADHVIARARWCSRAAATPKPRRPAPSQPAPTVALVRREPQS